MAGPNKAKMTMTQIGTIMQTANRTNSTTTTTGNLLLVGAAEGGLSMILSFLSDCSILVLRGEGNGPVAMGAGPSDVSVSQYGAYALK